MSEFDMYRGDYNDRAAMADWDRKYLYGDTNEPDLMEPLLESLKMAEESDA